jgi:zinc protease
MSTQSRTAIAKILATIIVATFVTATHAAASDAALKIAPVVYLQRHLANGLEVITSESHASPTVAVQVWYHVGAKNDPTGRSGFAHLFEHLMFKSTRHLKDEQFDRLTEDVGGSNNAFTSDDVTAYHEIIPSNHLETLLWAEAERMSNLNVIEAPFKSERAVVEEEYRQRVLASPYGRFQNAVQTSSYLKHPYKRSPIGSIEDLEAATLPDVIAFHDTYYRPDNATLVVTGDFDQKQLDAWIDRYFGPLKKPATAIPRVDPDEPAWTSDRRVSVHGPKVPLPAVALTWLAPPDGSADSAALEVAAAILSEGESSRLNESLVYRQQLATNATFAADLRAGPSLLVATAIAAGGKSLADVEAALKTQIGLLATKQVGAAELAKAKTQLLTKTLIERETPLGLGQALAAAAVIDGDVALVDRHLEQIQAVTPADVQRVMRTYVTTPHHVTIEYTQEGSAP